MTDINKAFQKNLLLLSVSVALALILAEITLRVVLPPPIVWKSPQESYLYDSELGHWLKPNQSAFTHDKVVSTNTVGIRDKEYAQESPADVYRMIALGDSQTFGNGLELTDTWPKQLETILNQTGNRSSVEVLNCGLPASDTWQHEIILKRMLTQYRPNAVVLAFYVNDVVKRFLPNPNKHEVDDNFRDQISYILKRSVLLLSLRTAWSSVIQHWFPSSSFLQQQALLKGEDVPGLQERWNQVETSLSAMKKMSDEHKVPFSIVSLPRRDQVDGRLGWGAYNNRLQSIAERYNIPIINVMESLRRYHKLHEKGLFIPWDGHNSEIANYIIAQEIAGKILDSGQSKRKEVK